MAVHFGQNVPFRVVDTDSMILVVNDRRARPHGRFRIEHGRKQFVIDLERAAAGLGGTFAVGNDRGNALANEANDRVEHGSVVRIAAFVLMPCA